MKLSKTILEVIKYRHNIKQTILYFFFSSHDLFSDHNMKSEEDLSGGKSQNRQ